ncbi:MAG TPA: ABC transporter permease [Nocardioidaceae bacterium]|nr:ABC transporter permease [Nocardioidaceae bacterium]
MTAAGTEQLDTVEPLGARGDRVFGWQDLIIPLLCTAVVVAELFYLSQAPLDPIERDLVSTDRIWQYTQEHIRITFVIVVLVLAVAVPLGVLITRRRTAWIAPFVLAFGNVGQAAPIVGLIAIIGSFFIGFWPVVLIIAAYSILPVLRNTIVGIQQVDDGVIDAARGMGMSPRGILFGVELPLAVPIIAAGARTSLVLAVAVVPLGTDLDAGGLGRIVFPAIKLDRISSLVAGALMIAVLALMIDWLGGLAQRLLTPEGIR